MDYGEDSKDRGSYATEDGEQCGIESGKSQETDDVPNQSVSSHSTSDDAEELLGAYAASGQERIERSQYNLCDEEMKTSLFGTSTNEQTESTPWPSQATIQDATTEATDDRSFMSAVVGDSISDSCLGLDQHVAEARANREQLQREREEREQFGRELERKGLLIREQRVRQRMDQKERVEPQQQEAHTADSQYTYSGVVPTENCENCGKCTCVCITEEQPQLQNHQCESEDCSVCLGRSCERREGEFVEARRGSITQEQNTRAAFSQQYGQYSRAAPAENCEICSRCTCVCITEEQPQLQNHQCETEDCSVCLGRSTERREREVVEARRESAQEQNICAAFSQQYGQYSTAAPTHNCWICCRYVDFQLPESHQECEPFECCICLGLLDPDIDCYTLPCLHQLHVECAIELLRNDHRVCPLCRIPLF